MVLFMYYVILKILKRFQVITPFQVTPVCGTGKRLLFFIKWNDWSSIKTIVQLFSNVLYYRLLTNYKSYKFEGKKLVFIFKQETFKYAMSYWANESSCRHLTLFNMTILSIFIKRIVVFCTEIVKNRTKNDWLITDNNKFFVYRLIKLRSKCNEIVK